MRSTRLEQKRTTLHQLLLLLITTLVAMIMLVSHGSAQGNWIDVIAVVCLAACLHVLLKERKLKQHEASLLSELMSRDEALDELGQELNEERFELAQRRYEADELEGRLREITMLYRAIHKLNTEPRNNEVSHSTLRIALELVGGDAGSIMLMDEDKRYLDVVTSIGVKGKAARRARQKVGEGVAGWVAEFGEPARIGGEAHDDERTRNLAEFTRQVKSTLYVPLKLKNETIGVMILGTAECEADEFNECQMSLATIFGEHASVAIMHSRLRCLLGYEAYC